MSHHTPTAVYNAAFVDAIKEQGRSIAKMHANWVSMYAFIKSKLSQESEDEVKCHGDYSTFSKDVFPKGLWLAIKEKHLVTTTS